MPNIGVDEVKSSVLAILLCTNIGNGIEVRAADYGQQNKKIIQKLFQHDLKGFRFYDQPMATFGVGSMYFKEGLASQNDSWLVGHPNVWFTDSIPLSRQDSLMNRIIFEGEIGSITLNSSELRSFGISAVLPAILRKLGISTRAKIDDSMLVRLTVHDVVRRELNWLEFKSAMLKGFIKPEIVELVDRKGFNIIAKDLSYREYQLTVNSGDNKELAAALVRKAQHSDSIPADTLFSIGIAGQGSDTFSVTATHDVIAAILLKAPPKNWPGVRDVGKVPEEPFELWPVLTDEEQINVLEGLFRKR